MKNRSFPYVLGIAVLLIGSLFSYSRSETIGNATTKLNVDGAALATMILSIALFVLCRRLGRTLRLALARVGLPTAISIPSAYRWVIGLAIPFFIIGHKTTLTDHGVTEAFGFGMSPFKLSVFLLVVLVAWLVALLQRLHDLTATLQPIAVKAGR